MNEYKNENNEKKRSSKGWTIFGRVILYLILLIYSTGISIALCFAGMSDFLPMLIVLGTSVIMLFLTILSVNGELFGFKDYDLLMSLPINVKTIIQSKFCILYFDNILLTAFLMMPAGLVYFFMVKPTVLFALTWLVLMITVPLIPITIATVIGALVMMFSLRFKHANAVKSLMTIAVILGWIIFNFSIQNNSRGDIDYSDADGGTKIEQGVDENSSGNGNSNISILANLVDDLPGKISKYYPPSILVDHAVNDGNVLALAGFTGVSLGWYWIFVEALSRKYKSINSKITAKRSDSNYKIEKLNKNSQLKSLYKKELKRFTSSSVYLTNSGIGALLAVVFCLYGAISGFDKIFGGAEEGDWLLAVVPFIISAIISMSCTTSTALSLEGKNVWILKSLPINSKTVYDSKILVNLTVCVPSAIISAVLLIFSLHPNLIDALRFILIPVVFSLYTSVMGIKINNAYCNYDWDNENQVVKRGLAVFIGQMNGMLVPIVVMLLSFIMPKLDYNIKSSGLMLIILVITILVYKCEVVKKLR
jgi:ABC-2 type transport system permease protein